MKSRAGLAIVTLVLALVVRSGVAAEGNIPESALLDKVRQGSTTQQQVAETLGKPWRTERARAGEVWEYWVYEGGRRVNVSIDFDEKGVVRGIEKTRLLGGP